MTVVVEFTLPAESFPFGRAVSADADVRVQLERMIPLNERRIPFIWATGERFDRFERGLRDGEVVTHVEAVTSVGDSVLYYVEWDTEKETFLNGLGETGGSIMEAHGDSAWSFTVRFRNHADLTRFHHFYQEEEFPVRIQSVSSLDEEAPVHYGFGLTPSQREALLLAVEEGYFAVPRETKLDEIGEELDITRQAASERVRRGAETVLRKALVGLVAEDLVPVADDSF